LRTLRNMKVVHEGIGVSQDVAEESVFGVRTKLAAHQYAEEDLLTESRQVPTEDMPPEEKWKYMKLRYVLPAHKILRDSSVNKDTIDKIRVISGGIWMMLNEDENSTKFGVDTDEKREGLNEVLIRLRQLESFIGDSNDMQGGIELIKDEIDTISMSDDVSKVASKLHWYRDRTNEYKERFSVVKLQVDYLDTALVAIEQRFIRALSEVEMKISEK